MSVIRFVNLLCACLLISLIESFLFSQLRHRHHGNKALKMAKDGKVKKTKAVMPVNNVKPLAVPKSPPMRVSNKINVPVRQQIAWAKAYKRLMAARFAPASTSHVPNYKSKNVKQVEEDYVEVDYVNVKPPAVFIDGYNVIGYINSVEKRDISLEDARDCLISDMSVLRGATGWWIELVFDAYGSAGGAESRALAENVLVTYTSRQETADTHIERRFAELRAQGFTNMIVVTGECLFNPELIITFIFNSIR